MPLAFPRTLQPLPMLVDEAPRLPRGAAGRNRRHRRTIATERQPIILRPLAPLKNDLRRTRGHSGLDPRIRSMDLRFRYCRRHRLRRGLRRKKVEHHLLFFVAHVYQRENPFSPRAPASCDKLRAVVSAASNLVSVTKTPARDIQFVHSTSSTAASFKNRLKSTSPGETDIPVCPSEIGLVSKSHAVRLPPAATVTPSSSQVATYPRAHVPRHPLRAAPPPSPSATSAPAPWPPATPPPCVPAILYPDHAYDHP
mgnify:CR=1 FL=1